MRDGGKGDRKRPLSVDLEDFNDKWDAIFGKKTTKPQPEIIKCCNGNCNQGRECPIRKAKG